MTTTPDISRLRTFRMFQPHPTPSGKIVTYGDWIADVYRNIFFKLNK